MTEVPNEHVRPESSNDLLLADDGSADQSSGLGGETACLLDVRNPERTLYETLKVYMIELRGTVQRAWENSAPHKAPVKVCFQIDRQDQLINVTMKQSSGNQEDDDAAIRAIQ